MPDDNDKEKQKNAKDFYEAATLGVLFPVAIGVGFGIGYGLDKVFHTWPWLTGIFTVFGSAAAFVQLFRTGSNGNGG